MWLYLQLILLEEILSYPMILLYQPQIISELNIGDISQVKYEEPKRFFYEIIRSSEYSQIAFSILAVFYYNIFYF